MVVKGGPLQDLLRQLGRERAAVPHQRRHGREPRRAGVRGDEGLDPAQAQHDGQAARGAEEAVRLLPGKVAHKREEKSEAFQHERYQRRRSGEERPG